jgi:hypothetical protein
MDIAVIQIPPPKRKRWADQTSRRPTDFFENRAFRQAWASLGNGSGCFGQADQGRRVNQAVRPMVGIPLQGPSWIVPLGAKTRLQTCQLSRLFPMRLARRPLLNVSGRRAKTGLPRLTATRGNEHWRRRMMSSSLRWHIRNCRHPHTWKG